MVQYPVLASAAPSPGNQTACMTEPKVACAAWGWGATAGMRARYASTSSGSRSVSSAIASKPKASNNIVPTGPPSAIAANIAVPTQAITLPACSLSTRARPHATAPVMMKLSAPPRIARPASSTPTDSTGMPTSQSDTWYSSPETAAAMSPATTPFLAPRLSE